METVHCLMLKLYTCFFMAEGFVCFLCMEVVYNCFYNKVMGKNSQNVFSQNMSDMLLHE